MEQYDILYVTDTYRGLGDGIAKSPLALVLKDIPGVRVRFAESAGAAMDIFELASRNGEKIDAVITDLALERPDSGVSVLLMARKHNEKAELFVYTGNPSYRDIRDKLAGKLPEGMWEDTRIVQQPIPLKCISEIVRNLAHAKEMGSVPQGAEKKTLFITPHIKEAAIAEAKGRASLVVRH